MNELPNMGWHHPVRYLDSDVFVGGDTVDGGLEWRAWQQRWCVSVFHRVTRIEHSVLLGQFLVDDATGWQSKAIDFAIETLHRQRDMQRQGARR